MNQGQTTFRGESAILPAETRPAETGKSSPFQRLGERMGLVEST
jgi:hypothetical protein